MTGGSHYYSQVSYGGQGKGLQSGEHACGALGRSTHLCDRLFRVGLCKGMDRGELGSVWKCRTSTLFAIPVKTLLTSLTLESED